jgi:hypothetical protein
MPYGEHTRLRFVPLFAVKWRWNPSRPESLSMRNRVFFSNAVRAAQTDLKPPSRALEACVFRSQIVVYAGYFDPSKLSKETLIRKKIVQPNEIRKSSRFEHHLCQLNTPRYRLLLLPPQLQFVLNAKSVRDGALAIRKVCHLTQLSPDVPLRSASINITWHMWPENGNVADLSRRIFGARTNPLHTKFDGPETFFGTYLSVPKFDGRLQLDVKPVEANAADGTEMHLSFSFNFSRDLPAEYSHSILQQHLGCWDKAFAATERVMSDIRQQFDGRSRKPDKPK